MAAKLELSCPRLGCHEIWGRVTAFSWFYCRPRFSVAEVNGTKLHSIPYFLFSYPLRRRTVVLLFLEFILLVWNASSNALLHALLSLPSRYSSGILESRWDNHNVRWSSEHSSRRPRPSLHRVLHRARFKYVPVSSDYASVQLTST